MSKIQTVYIPVSEFNSSELFVGNEGIENSHLDKVVIVEALVFTPEELKKLKLQIQEQLQEDIFSILDGFGVKEAMDDTDYFNLKTQLCDAVIKNLAKL